MSLAEQSEIEQNATLSTTNIASHGTEGLSFSTPSVTEDSGAGGEQQESVTAADESPTVTATEWAEAFSGTVDGVAESVPHLKRNTDYALKKVSDAISLQVNSTSEELKTLSYVHKIITSSMAELSDNISSIYSHVARLNARKQETTMYLKILRTLSADFRVLHNTALDMKRRAKELGTLDKDSL